MLERSEGAGAPPVPASGGPRTPPSPASSLPTAVVADAERGQVVALLRSLCADGHLTLEQFSDRVGATYSATTRGQLDAVTIDLPAQAPATTTTASSSRPRETCWLIGIMSGPSRRGRWRPGPRVRALAFWGGCHIDFRGAEIDGDVIHVRAVAIMGGIEIIVPEGVRVEVDGLPIMGGIDQRIADVPVLPGTPLIRVRAVAFWGGVGIRSRPSRSREERAARRAERHEQRHGRHFDPPPPPDLPELPSWPGRPARRAPEPPRPPSRATPEAADPAPSSPPGYRDAGPGVPVGPPPAPESLDGTVTVLFTDIEGFTAMTEALGDAGAQEVLRAHNQLVRAQVTAHGGREVKSQGDSFMVSFPGARRAVRCAVAIQRDLAAWTASHPDRPVRVRMGLHTGEAIVDADDLFGRAVIVASRISDQAAGGEVLVSSLLRELAADHDLTFGQPRRVTLKGLSGEHDVYPVNWRS